MHSDHRIASRAEGAVAVLIVPRKWLRLSRSLHGTILHLRQRLCGRKTRRKLSRLRPADRDGHRRKLFLQTFRVPTTVAGFVQEESDLYSAGNAAQRNSELRRRRPSRSEHYARFDSLGHSRPRRREARFLRLVRRADGLPERSWRTGV